MDSVRVVAGPRCSRNREPKVSPPLATEPVRPIPAISDYELADWSGTAVVLSDFWSESRRDDRHEIVLTGGSDGTQRLSSARAAVGLLGSAGIFTLIGGTRGEMISPTCPQVVRARHSEPHPRGRSQWCNCYCCSTANAPPRTAVAFHGSRSRAGYALFWRRGNGSRQACLKAGPGIH